jgi:hypothetical protein
MSVTSRSHQRSNKWRTRARVAAAVLASAVTVGAAGAATASAATPTLRSYNAPTRLVQSTGNLYWTSNSYSPFRATPYESSVWRASKTNTPGQEILLYSQSSTVPFQFGDLTYAQVNDNWYGYFIYNNLQSRTSRIERIGLTPTATPTILQSNLPMVGLNDLVTDGSSLYWADVAGLYRMPIGGGQATQLASGSNFADLGLDATNVIYTAGNLIRVVPKTGGTSTTLVSAPSPIATMKVNDSFGYDQVLFGETNGSVTEYSYVSGLGSAPEFDDVEPARPGYEINTVGFNAGAVPLFGECIDGGCDIDGTTSTPGAPVSVQGDGTSIFWGSNALYSMSDPVIW